MKILIAYDGTLHARKALAYGISKVREQGGELTVLHLFDPRVFIDYDAGPKAEELGRREAALQLAEAKRLLAEEAAGITSAVISAEGDASAIIEQYATEQAVDLVLLTPRFKKAVRALHRPAMVVPGTVLVPVDNTDAAVTNSGAAVREALALGSNVALVGIIPVHLYSKEERRELDKVRKDTEAVMEQLRKVLEQQGIKVAASLRQGYPDQEILRAAESLEASVIILPSGGTTPSELSKAAAVLLDQGAASGLPLVLVPQPASL